MSKSQKSIKSTIRKCVQERKTDSNLTHYTNFDKINVKHPERNWSEIGISRILLLMALPFWPFPIVEPVSVVAAASRCVAPLEDARV